MRRTHHLTASSAAALATLTLTTAALANGFETPGNGTEQMARGSAWLARASDPLATFYNPAALSRNGSGASVTVNLFKANTCFQRQSPGGGPAYVGSGSQSTTYRYGKVCSDPELFPNPQIAFQYRVTDKLGIGVAVLGPSAIGKAKFPETAGGYRVSDGASIKAPSGTRYVLTEKDAKIIWPQFAVGYEIAPNLRVGASFIWGVAMLKFGNVSMGQSSDTQKRNPDGTIRDSAGMDATAAVSAKDYFVPGIVLSSMYTLDDRFDFAAWFHWSDSVRAKGAADITVVRSNPDVANPSGDKVANKTPAGQTDANVPQPMEARVGVRYYKRRDGVTPTGRKDPLKEEVFDVELDLEWAHDSQFTDLELRFAPNTVVNGPGITADVPVNADVPHRWKDSYGARLGGDYVILPAKLAVRAGAWFQTSAVREEYLHMDFVPSQRIGLTVGGTFRAGPVDIQAGYQHVMVGSVDNHGNGQIRGLVAGRTVTDSDQEFRSPYGVNGGKLTQSIDVFSIGGVYRFLRAPPATSGRRRASSGTTARRTADGTRRRRPAPDRPRRSSRA
ncbi:MAG: outer membrane protein transport protein [Polyangiaceae bacterium]|nr:outer membrane protein transport protein [Polyangiaceae bacterium]